MPTIQAHRTRQHSNLRPKHKQTKKYLKPYWPFVPVIVLLGMCVYLAFPLYARSNHQSVLAYSSSMQNKDLLTATNNARTKNNQEPLKLNETLSRAAQAKANDMTAKNYWSHTSPDGTEPWAFVSSAGYQYQKAGENLAYGFLTSDETIAGWLNSHSHRANMLDPSFIDVGFGYANSKDFDKNGPATVIVAMYGRPITSPLLSTNSSTSSQPAEGVNTANGVNTLGQSQSINTAQILTGGLLPWISIAIALSVGSLITLLSVKYGRFLRRKLTQGEKFIIHHPVLDVSLVLLIIIGFLATRQLGTIL